MESRNLSKDLFGKDLSLPNYPVGTYVLSNEKRLYEVNNNKNSK